MRPAANSIGKNFRAMFRERRRHARRRASCPVRLPVGVSMPNELIDPEGEEYPRPIMGHTRDLCETGLSLLLPTTRLGRTDISDPGSQLRLVLSLPNGLVVLRAQTVHSERLEHEGRAVRLVGARITQMFDTDRRRYEDFLHATPTHEQP
jgi:PilZ domain